MAVRVAGAAHDGPARQICNSLRITSDRGPFGHDRVERRRIAVEGRGAGDQDVVSVVANEAVASHATEEQISSIAAHEEVVPLAAEENIVPQGPLRRSLPVPPYSHAEMVMSSWTWTLSALRPRRNGWCTRTFAQASRHEQ